MALNPEQVYKLGAEALGWDNSTAEGKALMAEDMELLKRLDLFMALPPSADHRHRLRRRNRFLSRSVLAQMQVSGTDHFGDLCQL